MVEDGEVFVGAHGAAAVVFFLTDDVDGGDVEGVGGADDRADVEIVLEVFDGDFKGEARLFESGENLVVREAFQVVNEVSGIFHETIVAHPRLL